MRGWLRVGGEGLVEGACTPHFRVHGPLTERNNLGRSLNWREACLVPPHQ